MGLRQLSAPSCAPTLAGPTSRQRIQRWPRPARPTTLDPGSPPGSHATLHDAVDFFVIALVTATYGGIAASAMGLGQILFIVFTALAVAGFPGPGSAGLRPETGPTNPAMQHFHERPP